VAALQELTASSARDAREVLRGLRDAPPPVAGRPRVALNMIVSVDGRVTIEGRSGGLGGPADREFFHALRAEADAVLAGASTVRTERYGPIIRDAAVRERRVAQGLRPQPLAVIATRSLDLDPALPLLGDAGSQVVLIGPATGELSRCAAAVEYIRTAALDDALRELHDRFSVRLLVCEGGPTIAGALAAAGLLDELFLTIAPRLVGGDPGPTFLDRSQLKDGVALTLRALLRAGSELFAHYAAGAGRERG